MQLGMTITQSGSAISGTWTSTSVDWNGQITGTMDGSSFSGQLAFSGTSASGAVCTGTANISGTASPSSFSVTSSTGVTGPTCPAPLPVGIQIDLHR